MKQLPVFLTAVAIDSLSSIAHFIANKTGSLDVALSFVDRIEQRCRKIGDAPSGGRLRSDLGPNIRTVTFENRAVILYRVENESVEIIDILYRGRQYVAGD
ncbi:MAG: type II toxin-antitoxin system RelE/ParE family toxin [Pseudomonadota bacterium]|nr:type II toxin-antitoxin system RelE/ParE family toxin [Pseudomonadota bacterium]